LKQEDALMDLSNVIGQLKDMSLQMHSEISRSAFFLVSRELECFSIYFSVLDPHTLNLSPSCRQNEGITYLDADVRELNYRVKGANDRGRKLLRR
jgi:hypothetical protein